MLTVLLSIEFYRNFRTPIHSLSRRHPRSFHYLTTWQNFKNIMIVCLASYFLVFWAQLQDVADRATLEAGAEALKTTALGWFYYIELHIRLGSLSHQLTDAVRLMLGVSL